VHSEPINLDPRLLIRLNCNLGIGCHSFDFKKYVELEEVIPIITQDNQSEELLPLGCASELEVSGLIGQE
jgi:hypothetical protein